MAAADQGGGVRRGVALGGGHAPGRGGAHVQVHMPRCTCPGAHVRGLGGEIVRGGEAARRWSTAQGVMDH